MQEGRTYEAIVIGSGMSGGWAAKELCEKGLKTLVLERGRSVRHGDYPTANKDPWDYDYRGAQTTGQQARQEKQRRTGFVAEDDAHFFVDDVDHPYQEKRRFDWIRGYQTGGRSLIWGRHCYRWSDLDFEANLREGIAVDWPIRYRDIAPWYAHVERFVGVSGEKLGLAHLPDGEFLKPMPLNCLEIHAREKIRTTYPERYLTIGRVAHITEPFNGRNPCQYRNRCSRGCPYGAYFSSVAVTLPAAEKTGNMTLRPHSIVSEILFDEQSGKATGVRIVDENTKEVQEFFAEIIFCNAGAMSSTAILLNSKSDRFPNGLGNDSGELGHNIMDHHYFVGAMGSYDGFGDKYYHGRRPTGFYIPKFRNINKETKTNSFLRGYGYQGSAGRDGWGAGVNQQSVGAEFKDNLFRPGSWNMYMNGFGEVLPDHNNRMYLDYENKDQWGLPTIVFDADFGENELKMREQMQTDAAEMLEVCGVKNIITFDQIGGMGKGIHEMGTARMGRDPRSSVLNKFNQMHAVPNVFVTDGACMTSAACVNPSITYMALTARAVDYAVKELNKRNI